MRVCELSNHNSSVYGAENTQGVECLGAWCCDTVNMRWYWNAIDNSDAKDFDSLRQLEFCYSASIQRISFRLLSENDISWLFAILSVKLFACAQWAMLANSAWRVLTLITGISNKCHQHNYTDGCHWSLGVVRSVYNIWCWACGWTLYYAGWYGFRYLRFLWSLNCCYYWTTVVILIKFVEYVAWILFCKDRKFVEKICYNSRDIEFS